MAIKPIFNYIIEGCDGTGKTTVTRELASVFGLDIMAFTKDGSKDVNDYIDHFNQNNIICDRSFISEYVYAKALGRKPRLTDEDFDFLMRYLEIKDWRVIVLDCNPEIAHDRLIARGNEELEVIKNLDKIMAEYTKVAEKYPDLFCIVDASGTSARVVKQVLEFDANSRRINNVFGQMIDLPPILAIGLPGVDELINLINKGSDKQ